LITIDEFSLEQKMAIEKYSSLIHFNLDNIGLKSLNNFPKLKELEIVRKSYIKNYS
jgi:hypothetical protein